MSRDEVTEDVRLLERWIAMLNGPDAAWRANLEVAEEMRQRWLSLLRQEAANG